MSQVDLTLNAKYSKQNERDGNLQFYVVLLCLLRSFCRRRQNDDLAHFLILCKRL